MESGSGKGGPKKDKLDVIVTFAAAKHPFKDKLERTVTVLELKQAAMAKFEVKESQTANEQVFFWLYHDSVKLEDQSRPLGEIAKDADKLVLMLIQQIIYGG